MTYIIYDKKLKKAVTKALPKDRLTQLTCYERCIPNLKKDTPEEIKNKEARYELREAK